MFDLKSSERSFIQIKKTADQELIPMVQQLGTFPRQIIDSLH